MTLPARRASATVVVLAVVIASVGLATAPRLAAQPALRLRRIGYVTSERRSVNVDSFEQGLRELGYAFGSNVVVDYRFAEGHVDRVPALVREVLRQHVDVFLAASPHVIRAVKATKAAVPVVGIDLESDPVAEGWVKSLAHPGGNLTGFFLDLPGLSGKQLQFLSEAMPKLQRVGVVWDSRVSYSQFQAAELAAQAANLRVQSLPYGGPEDFDAVFDSARRQRVEALVILSSPSAFLNLKPLADFAERSRVPAICVFPQFADVGGLMGYGPTLPDLFRQAAGYVDRILKGEVAADLPIQRPAIFRLTVNLKTAKALGLTIPPSILARAETIIPMDRD